MSHGDWQPELIQRYNIHGPRYTSYPTALSLVSPMPHAPIFDALATSNQQLSLYIHLPFCHKLCYYCGCNKVVTRHQWKADDYLNALEYEIAFYKPFIAHRTVGSLHLGGGTPTFLTEVQLDRLMAMLRVHLGLDVHSGHEISIEIDPRSCSLEKLEHLKHLGFNRVSYGVQDVNDSVQIAINRVQESSMVQAHIEHARALGFTSINLDLIYGLPMQTLAGFQRSLEQVIAWSPDRISLFSYAHLPSRFAGQRKIKEGSLPGTQDKLAMLQRGIEAFTQAGYQAIGMDHFAKPDDELAQVQRAGKLQRNFQGYTTHGSNALLGLGASSISQVEGVIWQNEKDVKAYTQLALSENLPIVKGVILSQDDRIRADLIAELICHFELNIEAFEAKWGIDFFTYFEDSLQRLNPFIDDRLVTVTERYIRVLPLGKLLVRSICSTFDLYLQQGQTRYSKVV